VYTNFTTAAWEGRQSTNSPLWHRILGPAGSSRDVFMGFRSDLYPTLELADDHCEGRP
jgi:hypothetical protein